MAVTILIQLVSKIGLGVLYSLVCNPSHRKEPLFMLYKLTKNAHKTQTYEPDYTANI